MEFYPPARLLGGALGFAAEEETIPRLSLSHHNIGRDTEKNVGFRTDLTFTG